MLKYIKRSLGEQPDVKKDLYLHSVPVQALQPFTNDIDFARVIAKVESLVPQKLLNNIDVVYVANLKSFNREGRSFNAMYKDGAVYVSPDQDDAKDLLDDIVHEIAHSIESPHGYEIYGDNKIKTEFLHKRKRLHDKLWTLGHKAPLEWFMDTEYNKEFDEFLLETVGYDKLRMICVGLFINAYAPTSLREYFATGFADFYLYPNHTFLQKISPGLTEKLLLLQDEENLDTAL